MPSRPCSFLPPAQQRAPEPADVGRILSLHEPAGGPAVLSCDAPRTGFERRDRTPGEAGRPQPLCSTYLDPSDVTAGTSTLTSVRSELPNSRRSGPRLPCPSASETTSTTSPRRPTLGAMQR